MRKSIQPKYAEKCHFDYHLRRIFVKGGGIVVAASSLLCGPNTALDIGNVFIFRARVELGAQVGGDGTSWAFEFGVAEDRSDAEAALPMRATDALECAFKTGLLPVVCGLRSDKMNLLGDGDEERNSIHEHDIDAQGHILAGVKDLRRETVRCSS